MGKQPWAKVQTFSTEPEAFVVSSLLEAYGIPAVVRNAGGVLTMFTSVLNSRFEVLVPPDREGDALELLASQQAAG